LTNDSDVFVTKRKGTGSCESDKVRVTSGCWGYDIDDVIMSGYVFRNDLGETHDQVCIGSGLEGGLLVLSSPISEFSVSQSSGNPSSAPAMFSIGLPVDTHVRFTIYDVTGRVIRTLADETMPAGLATLHWDGVSESGEAVPSGIYFYQIIADEHVVTDKLMLLR
jgi:hypothetical protein